MPIGDYLQKMRGQDNPGKGDKPDDAPKDSQDEKPEEMSREIKLTDDEQKAFKDAKPGSDLACEVHGTIENDGRFRVMSVSPLGGGESYGGPDQAGMAGQIAQRVSPNIQISPS